MSRRRPFATHAMPAPGLTRTPCCGVLPADLPRYHLISPDLHDVTCGSRARPRGGPRPVRALAEIVITTAQRPYPPVGRPFLPHGDDDGHIHDARCALCSRDFRVLVADLAESLVAAFPTADLAQLRPVLGDGPRPRDLVRTPLATLLTVVLTTTRITGSPEDEDQARPHGGAEGHVYDRRCALCAGDARTLAAAVEGALSSALPTVIPNPRRRRATPAPAAEGATE